MAELRSRARAALRQPWQPQLGALDKSDVAVESITSHQHAPGEPKELPNIFALIFSCLVLGSEVSLE